MADAYSSYRPQSRTALTHTNSLLNNLVSAQLAKPLNDSDPDSGRKPVRRCPDVLFHSNRVFLGAYQTHAVLVPIMLRVKSAGTENIRCEVALITHDIIPQTHSGTHTNITETAAEVK